MEFLCKNKNTDCNLLVDRHFQSQWEWDVQYQYTHPVQVSQIVVLWKWHASRNHLPYLVRSITHPRPIFRYNSHRTSEVSHGKCNGFMTFWATYILGQMSEDEEMPPSVSLSLKCWMCCLFLKHTAFIWDLHVRHSQNTRKLNDGIWGHWRYGLLQPYVLKFNILLHFRDRVGPRLQACFFQNKCYHIIIIYTVKRHRLGPN